MNAITSAQFRHKLLVRTFEFILCNIRFVRRFLSEKRAMDLQVRVYVRMRPFSESEKVCPLKHVLIPATQTQLKLWYLRCFTNTHNASLQSIGRRLVPLVRPFSYINIAILCIPARTFSAVCFFNSFLRRFYSWFANSSVVPDTNTYKQNGKKAGKWK